MGILFRVLLLPIRLILWPFRALFRSGGGRAANTVRKAAGNLAAGNVDDEIHEELAQVARPVSSFPFKTIGRPRLAETSGAELDLATVREFVERAPQFYEHRFDLFPQGSMFYEEIELEELAHALSADNPSSTDSRFVLWMDLFRRTINDNTRRLFLYYTPLIFVLCLCFGIMLTDAMPTVTGLPGIGDDIVSSVYVFFPLVGLVGLAILVLLYQWPFRVVSQRNLLGLDNYITSRFSRINQNFQVAKRFALNVERNKRMSQADELKDEAGVWTVAYNWFAMRLFLCERVVRNQMYQVNRNATLYAVSGMVICLMLTALVALVWLSTSPAEETARLQTAGAIGVFGLAFVIAAFTLVMGGAPGEPSRTLADNEWGRFGSADLQRTIMDHVGEDKLQIVTFRDRNRIE